MKTVFIDKPYEIGIRDTQIPVPRAGEALLQILYCGICGSDVASFTGNQPFTTYPRIPGHEFSARIVTIPENSRGLKSGDIVTANPYFNCGTCYSCTRGHVNCCTDNKTMGVQRDGCFSEYITMPVERIYDGKGLSAKQLALVEPFTISYHALHRAEIHKGDKVLVVGAGPIGLFALIAAKARGAEVTVADILDGRLKKALSFGAANVVNSRDKNLYEETMRITGGKVYVKWVKGAGEPQKERFLKCQDMQEHRQKH